MIDIQEKKRKIKEFLDQNGPSLPVQVARAIQMDPVFASAILSEILNSKEIITSHMRIGSSPLYLLPNQKEKLEEKTEHLKSAERETQEKLKQNKILYDEQETPATRVALRNLKDFATPFKHEEKIAWKYAFTPQTEIDEILNPKKPEIKEQPKEEPVPKTWEVKKEQIQEIKKEQKKVEPIFEDKPKEKIEVKKDKPKTFLEEIETFLQQHNTTITTIQEVDKTKVIATIQTTSEPQMLFAFNKKRITEKELFTCYKEAKKKNLLYQIITKEDPTKKMSETIEAYKSLSNIQKLEI